MRSVNGLERAAKLDYQDSGYKGDRTYQYENGDLTLVDARGTSQSENIKVEGLIENGVGNVYVDSEGEVSFTIYNDEWCATKSFIDKTITVEVKTDSNCNLPKTFAQIMTGNSEVMDNDPDHNVRYVGADPDNYVWFNKELWRIIGLFDGQAKIIRSEYYSEDIDYPVWRDTHSNDWATVPLKSEFNDGNDSFLGNIQSMDPVSYSYIDLKHVWNIGGTANFQTTTRSQFYAAERSNEISYYMTSHLWTGAIALMYPSDYGYSTSATNVECDTTVMFSWDGTGNVKNCRNNSWLYGGEQSQWFLTRLTNSYFAYYMGGKNLGFVAGTEGSGTDVGVKPTLYLKARVGIIDGTGTSGDPYKLSI